MASEQFQPRIIIKNLGPIKEADFPVWRFTTLIGPSASGKSTIAKAQFLFLHFFHALDERLARAFLPSQEEQEPLDAGLRDLPISFSKEEFFQYFGHLQLEDEMQLELHFSEGIFIRFFAVRNGGNRRVLKVEISQSLERVLNRHFDYIIGSIKEEKQKSFFYPRIVLRMAAARSGLDGIKPHFRPLFLHSSRSVFAYLQDILTSTMGASEKPSFDVGMVHLVEEVARLRRSSMKSMTFLHGKPKEWKNLIPKIEDKISGILRGSYHFSDGRDLLLIDQGKAIELPFAASGQQEVVWVLLALGQVARGFPSWIVLEEPEAHLFPPTQYELIKLLTLAVNSAKSNFLITTHSPYILTSLNNLLLAHRAGQAHPRKTAKVIAKEFWLNPDDFGAYYVDKGGIEDIFDRDISSIAVERIDEISEHINEEHNELLNIDLTSKREKKAKA